MDLRILTTALLRSSPGRPRNPDGRIRVTQWDGPLAGFFIRRRKCGLRGGVASFSTCTSVSPPLPARGLIRRGRGGITQASPAPPAHEGLLSAPAIAAMHAAPVPVTPFHPAGRPPAAVLAEMGTAASAFALAALLATVPSDPAHAAARPACHGISVLEAPSPLRVATRTPAGHRAPGGGVEGREGDALAAVLLSNRAGRGEVRGLMIERGRPVIFLVAAEAGSPEERRDRLAAAPAGPVLRRTGVVRVYIRIRGAAVAAGS